MDHYHLAKTIVSKLNREGFIAYFTGGWVRDFVMGHPSEDIDIATNATPIQIMNLFPQTILVGLAFGVVIVVFEGHQFEVATFRKDLPYQDGRRPEGIVLSTPQEDASRRDFTINGMFYDPLNEEIHDFVHGQRDINQKIIRTIGDPNERFFEDRLRMLRAFRFASRFGFAIEMETQDAIREFASKLLPSVAMERIYQEFKKMAAYPRFDEALAEMHQLGLLTAIFPELIHVHLRDLRQLVSSFKHFPPGSLPIFYLLKLFPEYPLEKKIEICRRLRASNKELQDVELAEQISHLLKRTSIQEAIEPYEWAIMMANSQFKLLSNIILASFSEDKRDKMLADLDQTAKELQPHILRHQQKQSMVTSSDLKNFGIAPSKKMGQLLKAAEKMAVNENILDKNILLNRLTHSQLWDHPL